MILTSKIYINNVIKNEKMREKNETEIKKGGKYWRSGREELMLAFKNKRKEIRKKESSFEGKKVLPVGVDIRLAF